MGISVIILAAGQGTRMRSELPKVLQPLAGQPLLGHVLATAGSLGIEDICVVYGHGGDAVPSAFPGPGIRWVLQAEQLGTGHAVQQAMPNTPDGNQVLVLFGDVPLLKKETVRRLLDATPADEFAVLTVDLDDPTGYGRIVREGDNVVDLNLVFGRVDSFFNTTDAAAAHLERRLDVLDGALHGVDRHLVALEPRLDDVHRVVDDLLGDGALAVQHHLVGDLGDQHQGPGDQEHERSRLRLVTPRRPAPG